jgi:predicted nucleotidyltransferase
VSEATIRMAAQIYKSRDAAKALLADRYEATVREHMEFIIRKQQQTGKSELGAVIELMKDLVARASNGVTELILLAAVVEMTEGFLSLPKPGSVVNYRHQTYAGKAVVLKHVTAEGKPAHLRMAERMILIRPLVRVIDIGPQFLISEKEIAK